MARRKHPKRKCIRGSLFERFAQYVKVTDACWIWEASKRPPGYGQMGNSCGSPLAAHRVSYWLFKGPLIEGLEIDHLCRNRACVNPSHLEQVPHIVNVRRSSNYLGPLEKSCRSCSRPFMVSRSREKCVASCAACISARKRTVAACQRCGKTRLLISENTICRPCYVYQQFRKRHPGMKQIPITCEHGIVGKAKCRRCQTDYLREYRAVKSRPEAIHA